MNPVSIRATGYITYNKDGEGLHISENHFAVLPDGLVLKAHAFVRVNHPFFAVGEHEPHTWSTVTALPDGAEFCGHYFIVATDLLPIEFSLDGNTDSVGKALYRASLLIDIMAEQLGEYSSNESIHAPLLGRSSTVSRATAFAEYLKQLSRTV